MRWSELIILGFSNLLRSKLRTFLTILGVIVGIGALVSMVSFGVGLQKNVTDATLNNEFLLTLNITSMKIDLSGSPQSQVAKALQDQSKNRVVLNDSLVEVMGKIPGVELVYPQVSFPAVIKLGKEKTQVDVEAIPPEVASKPPYNDLIAGRGFSSDTAWEICLSQNVLKKLRIKLIDTIPGNADKIMDSLLVLADADTIAGKEASLITAVVNKPTENASPVMMFIMAQSPFKEVPNKVRIAGIIREKSGMGFSGLKGDIIIPIKTSEKIPRSNINSVREFFSSEHTRPKSYDLIYVKVAEMSQIEPVKKTLRDKGLNVYSVTDELKEISKVFLIIDSLLGAVGTIALFVAALGIINTMVMSILERRREIGIMKAVGAGEGDIMKIFIVEASVIGFIGSVFGIIIGYGVTRLANIIMRSRLPEFNAADIDLFSFPWWLLAGAMLFSIVVSLLAGLYPAIRASRVDPVVALRHD